MSMGSAPDVFCEGEVGMIRRIVSVPDIVEGAPTVEGTRLTCADVARNFVDLGLQQFCEVYSHIAVDDVFESLNYCAEQQCVGRVLSYCHSCRLRQDEPDGGEVWLLSARLLRNLPRRT